MTRRMFAPLALMAVALVATACQSTGMPSAEEADNAVMCYSGSANAAWPAVSTEGEVNGVRLDAEIDVTQIAPADWIAMYRAFCLQQFDEQVPGPQ